jgi:uncharacterized membrane protein YfcA
MTPEPYTVPVLVVVFLSALMRSTFGFGAAVVAMPLLSFFLPVKVATALMAILSTVLASAIIAQGLRNVDVAGVWRMLLASVAGIPLGLLLLKAMGEHLAKAVLAAVIIAFSAYCLLSPRRATLRSDWPFGLWAGILGGAYSIYGPPLAVYGTLRGWTAEHFRTTIQVYLLPVGAVTLIAHAAGGLWTAAVGWYALASVPALLLGLLVGSAINRNFQGEAFVRSMHALLLLLGLALLASSLNLMF